MGGDDSIQVTASLDDTDAVSWVEAGTTRTLRTFLGLEVTDRGAFGSITGAMTARTYGQVNIKICATMTVELWAQVTAATTLRPELNHGFSMVDRRPVGDRRGWFKYQLFDCRGNSSVAGAGFTSAAPLRWSSSPWRVYQIKASVFGYNTYSNGAIAHRVLSQAESAVRHSGVKMPHIEDAETRLDDLVLAEWDRRHPGHPFPQVSDGDASALSPEDELDIAEASALIVYYQKTVGRDAPTGTAIADDSEISDDSERMLVLPEPIPPNFPEYCDDHFIVNPYVDKFCRDCGRPYSEAALWAAREYWAHIGARQPI